MDKERVRESFNAFLKMYFDSCKEVYEELDLKELKEGQFKYLRAIEKAGSMTMSELAEAFDLSKPTVSEIVRKFEATGVITRERSSDDNRVFNITLTKRGELLARTNRLESDRAIDKINARLDESEVNQLLKLFDKIGQV